MTNELEILLVDGDARDVDVTLSVLKKNNIANHVVRVHDRQEAFDYLFAIGSYASRDVNRVPQLIFLDLHLPESDGLEILRELRSNSRTRAIPVVMVTSSQEEKNAMESYELGVTSYLVRPIDIESFVTTITELGFYWMAVNKPA